jgi:hypothetical protein
VNPPRMTRREVMAGAGIVTAGTLLLVGLERGKAGTDVFGETGATVLVQGGNHSLPRDLAEAAAGANVSVVQLESDPVRQWRGAQAQLLACRETRLMGVTSWPEFLIVRGLAEESGRRVRYQQTDPSNGAVRWLIA